MSGPPGLNEKAQSGVVAVAPDRRIRPLLLGEQGVQVCGSGHESRHRGPMELTIANRHECDAAQVGVHVAVDGHDLARVDAATPDGLGHALEVVKHLDDVGGAHSEEDWRVVVGCDSRRRREDRRAQPCWRPRPIGRRRALGVDPRWARC